MNKKRIITGLIIFFCFMWICTLISKALYTSSLPVVSVQKPEARYIEHIVEAEGVVIEGSKQAINVLPGLRVEELLVRPGDQVEEGEALFRIDLADMKSITEELRTQKEKLLLQIDAVLKNQELEQQKKAIQEARAREDYDWTARQQGTLVGRAEESFVQAQEDLENHENDPVYITPQEDRDRAVEDYNNWVQEGKRLEEEITRQEKIVTNMDMQEDPSQEEEKELEKEKQKLQELRQALADHQENAVNYPDFSGEDAALSAWEKEQELLEDALQSAAYGEADAKGQRDEAVRQAQRNMEDIQFPESVDAALSLYRLELETVQKELAVYEEMEAGEGIIRSPEAGTVTDVLVSVGGRVPDTASLLMTDDSIPFQFKVNLDQEKKKYIGLGDAITLKLDGISQKVEGKVDYLSENNLLPGSYQTYINLPRGTGTPGQSGTLIHSETGEKHNLCIPLEALHIQENKTFVYLLKKRKGILGMEYYVEELLVKVLDKNNDWAAIEEGVLDAESMVIISSDKEIARGNTVRYPDEDYQKTINNEIY